MWVRASDGMMVNVEAIYTADIERRASDGAWLVVAYLLPECDGVCYGPAAILHEAPTRPDADARLTDLFLHLGRRKFALAPRARARVPRRRSPRRGDETAAHD